MLSVLTPARSRFLTEVAHQNIKMESGAREHVNKDMLYGKPQNYVPGQLLHLLEARDKLLRQVFLAIGPQHAAGGVAALLHAVGKLDERGDVGLYTQ